MASPFWNATVSRPYKIKDRMLVVITWHDGSNRTTTMTNSRYVMARKLGRLLAPNELVGHKDRNPMNDDPDNLEVKIGATDAQREVGIKLGGRRDAARRAEQTGEAVA